MTERKEKTIGELTVDEFSRVYMSLHETKALLQAKEEEAVTRRVFRDAEILGAVQPFRIRTTKEAEDALAGIRRLLANGANVEIVIAFAIARKEGA